MQNIISYSGTPLHYSPSQKEPLNPSLPEIADRPTQLDLVVISTPDPVICLPGSGQDPNIPLHGEENLCNSEESLSLAKDITDYTEVPISASTCKENDDLLAHISKTSIEKELEINDNTKESNIIELNTPVKSSNQDDESNGKENGFYNYSRRNPTNFPLTELQDYGLHEYFRYYKIIKRIRIVSSLPMKFFYVC